MKKNINEKSKYLDLFNNAILKFRKEVGNIKQKGDKTWIIALSRKGPMLLRRLFTDDELNDFNISTEHALLFLFDSLSREYKGNGDKINLCILDDAIYYGTTIESLVKEVKTYCTYYNITANIYVYTVIKANDAKDFQPDQFELITTDLGKEYDDTYNDFSHYFVKRLMAFLRQLHNTMEVEFPVFEYKIPDTSHETFYTDGLLHALKNKFGQNNVYKVEHHDEFYSFPIQDRAEHGNNISYNVILNDGIDNPLYQFRKLRIFVAGRRLNVVCMSPAPINEDSNIDSLFCNLFKDTTRNRIDELWRKIIAVIDDESVEDDEIKRNKRKCKVVLANYLLSLCTFISIREQIEEAFKKVFDDCKGGVLDNKSWEYMTAGYKEDDYDFTKKLSEIYTDLVGQEQLFPQPNLPFCIWNKSTQIFENDDYAARFDLEMLSDHNIHMLHNSKTNEEAISALFFNQNVLLERRTRTDVGAMGNRLHFGYTFNAIEKEMIDHFYMGTSPSADLQMSIHKWVDESIDKGCIVPQYIIDHNSKVWVRVFRPGENEEKVLSHLSRYVFFVFRNLAEVIYTESFNFFKTYYVPVELMRCALFLASVDYKTTEENKDNTISLELNGELELQLDIKGRNGIELKCFETDVLDYMERMHVLTHEAEYYRISDFIKDIDLVKSTTIDWDLQQKIKNHLLNFMRPFKEWNIPYYMNYAVFNYYRKEYIRSTGEESLERCKSDIMTVINNLRQRIGNVKSSSALLENSNGEMIKNCFRLYTNHVIHPRLMMNREFDGKGFGAQQRQWMLVGIALNVMYAVYFYYDKDLLSNFLKETAYDYISFAGCEKFVDEIESIVNAENTLENYSNVRILNILQNAILSIV